MERRDAIKLVATAAIVTTAANAYDVKKVINKMDMKIKDPANPTKGELKHSPAIKIGKKDKKGFTNVKVTVGQKGIVHPSADNHWIYEIELFADGKKVAVTNLEPVISRGFLACKVKLDSVKELSAVAKCNLHGNYTSSVSV